ncbi:hypothetical protein GCM10010358_77970 [Streptomyces minutiscleroticus]|uniref:Transposase n=1 Tax=Streptomyces minutiscleroticus TaxID=68238 RepID=A0A918P2A3_9ACTN|nr:hypothetical protein [Streptomyces minutiscleroticus]GGY14208.1 hypothetical protein GCM10010358_77970 [Streptomyces minutiscleroticus]
MATADPAALPEKATWYLATDLPRPHSPRAATSPHPPADLAEVVRIYGLRHWIEQSYQQVKDELGRADFHVRSDTAIRRHQTLVNCAFSFCWDSWFASPLPAADPSPETGASSAQEERGNLRTAAAPGVAASQLTPRDPGRSWLADALGHAATLLASLDEEAPAHRTPGPHRRRHHRQTS